TPVLRWVDFTKRDLSQIFSVSEPGSPQSCGSYIQPVDILVVRAGDWRLGGKAGPSTFSFRRCGSGIAPLVNLRMAIGKRESAGTVVVVRRQIIQAEFRRIARVNAIHAVHEMAIIDAL